MVKPNTTTGQNPAKGSDAQSALPTPHNKLYNALKLRLHTKYPEFWIVKQETSYTAFYAKHVANNMWVKPFVL
jgi:hypothetical protein